MKIRKGEYLLRDIMESDAIDFCELIARNRSRIETFFPFTVKENENVASSRKFISDNLVLSSKKEIFLFVIEEVKSRRVIGAIYIKNIDWSIPKAEYAFFIDSQFERKGIISSLLASLTDYAFEVLKMNKVYLRIAQDNQGSIRVAEKNGFVLEGILRNDFRTNDNLLIDVCYYGLLKNK